MARGSGRGTISVKGGPQCRAAFTRLGKRAKDDLPTVNADAAQIILRRADALVPRLSGALAATGRIEREAEGSTVEYGGLVPYAGPIHYGWRVRNIEPQPWLADATEQTRDEVALVYAKEADGLVRKFDAEAPA